MFLFFDMIPSCGGQNSLNMLSVLCFVCSFVFQHILLFVDMVLSCGGQNNLKMLFVFLCFFLFFHDLFLLFDMVHLFSVLARPN